MLVAHATFYCEQVQQLIDASSSTSSSDSKDSQAQRQQQHFVHKQHEGSHEGGIGEVLEVGPEDLGAWARVEHGGTQGLGQEQ